MYTVIACKGIYVCMEKVLHSTKTTVTFTSKKCMNVCKILSAILPKTLMCGILISTVRNNRF